MLQFQNKGNAFYDFLGTSSTAAILRLYENTGNGTNSVTIAAPDSITADVSSKLPGAQPAAAGYMLTSATNGVWSWVNGSQVAGTATNDNASAGNIGEVISSTITRASATSISNNTLTNLTSVSLTAGDWDVYCNAGVEATTVTVLETGLNTVSVTLPNKEFAGYLNGTGTIGIQSLTVPGRRFSLSGTTTVYLVLIATITGSGFMFGNVTARRAR